MLSVKNDTFTELEHKSVNLIDGELYNEYKCSAVESTLVNADCLGDKIITEVYPDGRDNVTTLQLLDPEEDTCKTIADITFSAEYGTYSCVSGSRYFSMITAEEIDGKLYGRVSVYDVETDEFVSTDPYEIWNVAQYITPYKNDEILFLYYEANTQDRVVMSLNLSTNEAAEIFRETNMNEELNSPVALTANEDNIVLVLQYVKNDVYHTKFEWISPEGELLKTEEPNFYKFFDSTDYLITDFEINGDYYYLKAAVEDEEEYFIFKRDGYSFHVVLPAICRLNHFAGDSFSDEENLLFYQNQNNSVLGDLINIDLKNDSFGSYHFSSESLIDNTIRSVKCSSDNSLIIIYDDNSGYPKCRIIPDYTSIDAQPLNASLYISPRQQLEIYMSSDKADPGKIEELKKQVQESEDWMKENNFRWKFAYSSETE